MGRSIKRRRNKPPIMTLEMARSAGQDAANINMRKAGRVKWNRSDYNVAVATINKLYWDKQPGVNPRRARRNPPAAAPGPGRLIYPRVLYVVAQKDPRGRDNHPCDSKCRAANHVYKHSYAGRRPVVAAYGTGGNVTLTDFKGW